MKQLPISNNQKKIDGPLKAFHQQTNAEEPKTTNEQGPCIRNLVSLLSTLMRVVDDFLSQSINKSKVRLRMLAERKSMML